MRDFGAIPRAIEETSPGAGGCTGDGGDWWGSDLSSCQSGRLEAHDNSGRRFVNQALLNFSVPL
jgi:hypothetical protein